ncbi:Fur family transcriptional regulator [Geoalkalibacter halelectricus]|uniref:Ferric uptake regulation protein n=1 Tax=Geoalkalibacter halelectricus TaxID=2847045 RepID=A0ABY5ZKY6_9BACT|nr:transcriptional repressor [Geoalkalibacter halelectricus]MDO3379609.1 transcriptional repressor [Geoalkalibacter halelectricus]UWZ78575.1 transcriptional repressor [Geoalkalibacter halelectricus]
MGKIRDKFRRYLSEKGLKSTQQRDIILEEFLAAGSHLSIEELYLRIREKHPNIGYATVYRTLKLFSECGIAEEHQFGDGQTRYESVIGEEHHDHLICTRCKRIIEFEDPRIETLQDEVARRHNFKIENHRLELYGLCADCQKP